MEYNLILARSAEQFSEGATLFREYAASLDFDLCFQDFDKELAEISLQYNQPQGALIVLCHDLLPVGCAGVRKWDASISELKRMYIQPAYRGKGLSKLLLEEAIRQAQQLGYGKMRLDTMGGMKEAIALYQSFGFYSIEPYRFNPSNQVLYFEKKLEGIATPHT